MAILPPQPLDASSGTPETTSCVITVRSHTNDAATLVCNGVPYTIATGDWVAVGTDHPNHLTTVPQACFTAVKTVTLPAVLADYPYTVTQGANTIECMLSNKPGINDDWAAYVLNCDYQGAPSPGFYPHIKDYKLNGPLHTIGIFGMGDLFYPDTWLVDDTGPGGTGLKSVKTTWPSFPDGTYYVFDYALAYMAGFGMLSSSANTWGLDEDRIWCRRKMNIIPQLDDHMAKQNQRGTGAPYAQGKAAYDAFFGPLQPIAANNNIRVFDTTSNHWGYSVGGLKVVSVDGITGAGPTGTQRFTTGQKKDILNALNTSEPFKWLAGDFGVRYLDAANISQTSGAQEALHYEYLADFQQLFTFDAASSTAAGLPASIMANPKTNGVEGVFMLTNHDFHQQIAQWNHAPAYTGNLAEAFHLLTHGSNNRCGSPAMGATLYNNIKAGIASGNHYTYNNITVRWAETGTASGVACGMRIERYNSRIPGECHFVMLDANGNEVDRTILVERGGNEGVPTTWERPVLMAGAGGL